MDCAFFREVRVITDDNLVAKVGSYQSLYGDVHNMSQLVWAEQTDNRELQLCNETD